MNGKIITKLGLIIAIALTSNAFALEESEILLKDGIGKDQVLQNCTMCHSLDYIQMNSGFLDHTAWEKLVNKMIGPMGAPISPADSKLIVEYLTKNYGK